MRVANQSQFFGKQEGTGARTSGRGICVWCLLTVLAMTDRARRRMTARAEFEFGSRLFGVRTQRGPLRTVGCRSASAGIHAALGRSARREAIV